MVIVSDPQQLILRISRFSKQPLLLPFRSLSRQFEYDIIANGLFCNGGLRYRAFHPFPVKVKVTQSSKNFFRYWLPVISWMCFIFWMSTETFSSPNTFSLVETVIRFLVPKISFQEVGLIHAFIRKSGHVIEYFILGLLLFRAFRGGSAAAWNWRWFWEALIVVVL
jgi:hypothetical protein